MAMQRLLRVVLTVVLVGGGLTFTFGGVAVAECTRLDPWPSFTEAVPSAKTVFVGTVTDTPELGFPNNRFTLRVDEVLRGDPPAVIDFYGFKSGMPLTICPGDSVLRVRKNGERLAFAMDARLPGVRGRIDAVAFVGDSEPSRFMLPEMEQLPLPKVRRLAGHAADGSTVRHPTGRQAVGPRSRASAKKVGPGIWRVTDDQTGDDMDRIRFIAAGPGDVMWLAGAHRLSRLGATRAITMPQRVHKVRDLDVAPDGRLLVSGVDLAAYDQGTLGVGTSWTKYWSGSRERPGGFQSLRLMTADGTLWAASNEVVSHWGEDGWTESAHGCYCTTTAMAETSGHSLRPSKARPGTALTVNAGGSFALATTT